MKKATTTNETTFICVKPIIKAEYTIRIVGDSPLLREPAGCAALLPVEGWPALF